MKNIFKYIFTAGVAMAALSSCDLNLFPIGSIVVDPSASVIEKQSDLSGMEGGLLSTYRGRQRYTNFTTEEAMYGNFNAATDFANNMGQLHRLEQNIASDYDLEDYYAGNYGSIKNFNVFLSNANGIKDPALKKKAEVVKGYAFLFRADCYLGLVRHYGKAYGSTSSTDLGVAIVTEFDLNAKPARNTVKEVYDQVKADLDSAAFFLAGVPGKVNSQKPTIDAVNALYARYYLDTKDYAKAAEYAVKVIDNTAAGYKLSSTAAEMEQEFTYDNGKENIMQLYSSLSESGNAVDMFTYLVNYTSSGQGYVYVPYFIPTEGLIATYETSDLRFKAWFTNNKRSVRQNSTFYKGDFYVFTKFEGNPNLSSSGIPTARNAAKPFTLSECLLIAAEAYAMNSDVENATKYLNTLQAARGAVETVATMANVQKEWTREKTGEGFRLSNLKRWGLGFEARTAQAGAYKDNCVLVGDKYDKMSLSADDYRLVWPIPSYEIKVNENMKQNPGYESVE